MFESYFNSTILTIYADCGGEYEGLNTMLANMGNQHLFSPLYTQQRVGIVEHRLQLIMETILTLLHQDFMPLQYWSCASQISV